MSLEKGFSWNYLDWNFTGYSLAGITTSILCRNAAVLFDVGQGLPFQHSARHILVTHAHLDHAAGVPYLLAQKAMAGQKESNVLVPPALAGPLREILRIWQSVDDFPFPFSLRANAPGELIELDKTYSVRPFRTMHRVESQGYLLYQKKKRLKQAFQGGDREVILRAKAAGEDPNETWLEPVVAFTGDTQIEFLEMSPEVALAKILFLECTFWDEARPVEEARRWGHIHFNELIEILPRLKNEKIVLIHASVRYSTAYLQEILERRLPEKEKSRVVLFPRPV